MPNLEPVRDYYKILMIGASGSGKTFSFYKMDPETFGFINVENKPLPFPMRLKYHARPKKYAGVLQALKDYIANPAIKVVGMDSISATMDILLQEHRANFSGWDIWNAYNKSIGELMNLIKEAKKEIVITAHYEILNIEGAPEKRVKVKGKEWEGVMEKEFTMVLYPHVNYRNGKPESFILKLAAEGTSAKCPPAIFGEGVFEIPNDFRMVYDKVLAFANANATVPEPSSDSVIFT